MISVKRNFNNEVRSLAHYACGVEVRSEAQEFEERTTSNTYLLGHPLGIENIRDINWEHQSIMNIRG